MKSLTIPGFLIINILFLSCLTGCSPGPDSIIHGKDAIIHTVMFTLRKASPGSEEAEDFLKDGKEILSSIPGVEKFEVRRHVSEKNNFQYGFSMEFTDRTAFDNYLGHPLHVSFVSERWEKEVSAFQEADYTVYHLD